MSYFKCSVRVNFDYPVYVNGPDDFDTDDFVEVIEGDRWLNCWTFADYDVMSAVMAALPMAEYVSADIGSDNNLVDACPRGALVYDLDSIVEPDAVRRYQAEKRASELKERIEQALYKDDFEMVGALVAEILETMRK